MKNSTKITALYERLSVLIISVLLDCQNRNSVILEDTIGKQYRNITRWFADIPALCVIPFRAGKTQADPVCHIPEPYTVCITRIHLIV